jgi:hypothetical protein
MAQTRLFDLLGDFTAAWPRRVVRQDVGWVNPGSTAPDPGVWLAALNAAVTVDDVRTGVSGDRATVRARLRMPTPAVSAGGWPFVLKDLPDVEFRIQALDGADRYVELFVSVGPDGVEVLLERLPVEIRLPVGFVTPADGPNPLDQDVGEFVPGRLDDLRVVYRRQAPTSVFVHVRLHATTDQQFTVRPAVPVSFGPCRLADLPCLAVHDFRLIPSPAIARDNALTGQRLDQLGYRRDYTDAGEPGSLTEAPAGVAIVLHHEIGPVILDIMAVETGTRSAGRSTTPPSGTRSRGPWTSSSACRRPGQTPPRSGCAR